VRAVMTRAELGMADSASVASASPAPTSSFKVGEVGSPTPSRSPDNRRTISSWSDEAKREEDEDLGLVDVASSLHRLADSIGDRITTRWRLADWVLGTQRGQFLSLAIVAVALNILGGAFWRLGGGNEIYDTTWWESLWFSWGMFFDPGTQMGFAATEPFHIKFVAIVFSVFGFIYNILMLGLIVELVKNMLEHWKKWRGRIIANNHTLVIGWTGKTLYAIEELWKSFQDLELTTDIVILADEDIFYVRHELFRHFPKNIAKSIRVRSGSTTACEELERVSAASARQIVVLGEDCPEEKADLVVLRTIVALAALPQRPMCPILAEVTKPEMAHVVSAVVENAVGVFPRNAVRRLACLHALQPVVGETLLQLMSFDGADLYCIELAAVGVESGATLQDAQAKIPLGTVVGYQAERGNPQIAPEADYRLVSTDQLVVMAESLTSITSGRQKKAWRRRRRKLPVDLEVTEKQRCVSTLSDVFYSSVRAMATKRSVIFVGWPACMDNYLHILGDYMSAGSSVLVLSLEQDADRRLREIMRAGRGGFTIEHKVGDPTNIYALADLPLQNASAVFIVADRCLISQPSLSDSACVGSCITLHKLLSGHHPKIFTPGSGPRPRLICEILSPLTARALPDYGESKKDMCSEVHFLHTAALEASLFTVACSQTRVYNTILMLLAREQSAIITITVEDYFEGETESAPGVEQLFNMTRSKGDVMLGYVREGTFDPIFCLQRFGHEPLSPKAHLILATRRRSLWATPVKFRI